MRVNSLGAVLTRVCGGVILSVRNLRCKDANSHKCTGGSSPSHLIYRSCQRQLFFYASGHLSPHEAVHDSSCKD